MRIAIDVSPLQTGHKVRGVGFYLNYLKSSLEKYFPENEYIFFTERNTLKGNIDLVHYPYFDPFFITLPLIKKYPTVVTVHDLTPLVFPDHFPAGIKGRLRWQIQKMNLRNVDMIIADSEASRKDILTIGGVANDRVAVTYLAAGDEFKKVDITKEKAEILKSKYSLPKKFALYVGDVTWNKNLPNLVKAAEQSNIPLVMVGKSLVQTAYDYTNPWNRDLVFVQQFLKNTKNIKALGFVPTEDLVSLYNSAVLFIMPSYYEGFGLPVIEAMQSGCPVITTKNGSLSEVAGEAALYVDAANKDSLASAMTKLYSDHALQKELSKKGVERAKEFTWKKTAEQTAAIYKAVLK